jgi:hypothetical protein
MSAARKYMVVVLVIPDKGSNRAVICFGHPHAEDKEGKRP